MNIEHDTILQIIAGGFIIAAAGIPTVLTWLIKRHVGSAPEPLANMISTALENQGEVKATLAAYQADQAAEQQRIAALVHAHHYLDAARIKPIYDHLGLIYDFPSEEELVSGTKGPY